MTAADDEIWEGTGQDWVTRIMTSRRERSVDIVALLDSRHRIIAVVIPASPSRSPLTVPLDVSSAELSAGIAELAQFDRANPLAPYRVDPSMQHWWQLAQALADAIRPHLTDGAELIVLPGRRLSAAPLHLAGWPERPLLASRPVSVCPNLRVLLGRTPPIRTRLTGIVAVPKLGDRIEFVTALKSTSGDIATLAAPATVLADTAADIAAVLALSSQADEILFACHGVSSAGPKQGAGICVAAHGLLPPNPLPIEDDSTLQDFTLSWSSIIRIASGPRVVVSIACSSGRILIGPGGTRLGLEQGFISGGGSAIVSPLWNVDQQASLAWLRAFYRYHQAGRIDDLPRAHQAACMTVLRDYPHPYAWGPFLLTRRLAGENHD